MNVQVFWFDSKQLKLKQFYSRSDFCFFVKMNLELLLLLSNCLELTFHVATMQLCLQCFGPNSG